MDLSLDSRQLNIFGNAWHQLNIFTGIILFCWRIFWKKMICKWIFCDACKKCLRGCIYCSLLQVSSSVRYLVDIFYWYWGRIWTNLFLRVLAAVCGLISFFWMYGTDFCAFWVGVGCVTSSISISTSYKADARAPGMSQYRRSVFSHLSKTNLRRMSWTHGLSS